MGPQLQASHISSLFESPIIGHFMTPCVNPLDDGSASGVGHGRDTGTLPGWPRCVSLTCEGDLARDGGMRGRHSRTQACRVVALYSRILSSRRARLRRVNKLRPCEFCGSTSRQRSVGRRVTRQRRADRVTRVVLNIKDTRSGARGDAGTRVGGLYSGGRERESA